MNISGDAWPKIDVSALETMEEIPDGPHGELTSNSVLGMVE